MSKTEKKMFKWMAAVILWAICVDCFGYEIVTHHIAWIAGIVYTLKNVLPYIRKFAKEVDESYRND